MKMIESNLKFIDKVESWSCYTCAQLVNQYNRNIQNITSRTFAWVLGKFGRNMKNPYLNTELGTSMLGASEELMNIVSLKATIHCQFFFNGMFGTISTWFQNWQEI